VQSLVVVDELLAMGVSDGLDAAVAVGASAVAVSVAGEPVGVFVADAGIAVGTAAVSAAESVAGAVVGVTAVPHAASAAIINRLAKINFFISNSLLFDNSHHYNPINTFRKDANRTTEARFIVQELYNPPCAGLTGQRPRWRSPYETRTKFLIPFLYLGVPYAHSHSSSS
jgi:hypothetical protein